MLFRSFWASFFGSRSLLFGLFHLFLGFGSLGSIACLRSWPFYGIWTWQPASFCFGGSGRIPVIKRREQSLLDQSIIITVYIHAVCAASWLISLEAANHADKGPVVLG
ncbi:uncharacterized protein LOC120260887 isoform X2 [Dioscorea cayenensis subsp. rotundata]|uniref:Uncharacterized protein LOC120260887 isoform X2 n=1 Tax=Dioscorea cayennensis subsp. rotundata TaxID=55577 RepID=A0AB40BCG5_DIOCR|nr:uncharacterized protein LOC120260887 isoform X2 [Dioscorea cayenensis subsp. rotundata]